MRRQENRYLSLKHFFKRSGKRIGLITLLIFTFQIFLDPFFYHNAYAEIYSTISGVVKDKQTSQPIAGIKVIAISLDAPKPIDSFGETNPNGKYIIRMLPPGTYHLTIGFEQNYVRPLQSKVVTIIRGRNVINADLFLERGSIVEGKVLSHDGATPVKDVGVFTVSEIALSGAQTEQTGDYKVQGLMPNQQQAVFAGQEGQALVVRQFTTQNADEAVKNVGLVLGNPQTILKGKITQNGLPIAEARLVMTSVNCIGHAVTDNQGNYETKGLKPGSYDVLISAEGFNPSVHSDIAIVDGEQKTQDFALTQAQVQNNLAAHKQALQELFGNKTALAMAGPLIFALSGAETLPNVRTWVGPAVLSWLMQLWILLSGGEIISIVALVCLIGAVAITYKGPECELILQEDLGVELRCTYKCDTPVGTVYPEFLLPKIDPDTFKKREKCPDPFIGPIPAWPPPPTTPPV